MARQSFSSLVSGPAHCPSGQRGSILRSKPLDLVCRNYNVTRISPRQVDCLVTELLQAGHDLTSELILLSSFGEKFLGHLGEVTGTQVEARAQGDLITYAEQMKAATERAGDVSSGWDDLVTFLKDMHRRSCNVTWVHNRTAFETRH